MPPFDYDYLYCSIPDYFEQLSDLIFRLREGEPLANPEPEDKFIC
jgi:hypothetical protein